jgi:hypothetical protein
VVWKQSLGRHQSRRSNAAAPPRPRDLGVTGPRIGATIPRACHSRTSRCPSFTPSACALPDSLTLLHCSPVLRRCCVESLHRLIGTKLSRRDACAGGRPTKVSELRERLCAVDTFTPHQAHIYKTAVRPRAMAAEHSSASYPQTCPKFITPKTRRIVTTPPSSLCRVR